MSLARTADRLTGERRIFPGNDQYDWIFRSMWAWLDVTTLYWLGSSMLVTHQEVLDGSLTPLEENLLARGWVGKVANLDGECRQLAGGLRILARATWRVHPHPRVISVAWAAIELVRRAVDIPQVVILPGVRQAVTASVLDGVGLRWHENRITDGSNG